MSSPRYTPRRQFRPQQQNFTSTPSAPKPAPKAKCVGRSDLWITLQRVSDPESNTMAMTRAMQVPGGVLILTKTRTPQGVSEALAFVPGASLGISSSGPCLVPLQAPKT